MRPDWEELLWAFAIQDFDVSIVSNGTLLSDSVVKRLASIPNLDMMVSLDGDTEKNDQVRGGRGAQRKTVAGLRRLREAGLDVQVNATIIRDNLSEVAYLTKLSRDLDLSMRFSLLNPYNGRGKAVIEAALSVDQMLALREFCHEARQHGSKVFLNVPPLLQYPEDIIPIRSPSCGWTKSYCGVTYDGYVTICGVAGADETLHVGNVMTSSFAEIWREAPLFNYLRNLGPENLKGVCGKCSYKEACGGACRLSAYKSAGDFTASYSMCQAFYDQGVIDDSRLLEQSEVVAVATSPPLSAKPGRLLPLEPVSAQ